MINEIFQLLHVSPRPNLCETLLYQNSEIRQKAKVGVSRYALLSGICLLCYFTVFLCLINDYFVLDYYHFCFLCFVLLSIHHAM